MRRDEEQLVRKPRDVEVLKSPFVVICFDFKFRLLIVKNRVLVEASGLDIQQS